MTSLVMLLQTPIEKDLCVRSEESTIHSSPGLRQSMRNRGMEGKGVAHGLSDNPLEPIASHAAIVENAEGRNDAEQSTYLMTSVFFVKMRTWI
jgi:hypothetical protein